MAWQRDWYTLLKGKVRWGDLMSCGGWKRVIPLSSSLDRPPPHQSHPRTMSLKQNFQRNPKIDLFRSWILSHSYHNLRKKKITTKIKGQQFNMLWKDFYLAGKTFTVLHFFHFLLHLTQPNFALLSIPFN